MARRRKPAWIGGALAVVAVLGLIGQCGRAGQDEQASALPTAAPLTSTPRAVAPAVLVPTPTTSAEAAPTRTTAPPPASTPRRAPTTTTATPEPEPAPEPAEDEDDGGDVYYENCAAVRAAGADPIRIGEPGYRPGLDSNRDGVGCE